MRNREEGPSRSRPQGSACGWNRLHRACLVSPLPEGLLRPSYEKFGRTPWRPPGSCRLNTRRCLDAPPLKAVRDAHRDLIDVFAGVRRLRRVVETRRGTIREPGGEPEQVSARIEGIGESGRDQAALEPAGAAVLVDQRAAACGRPDVTEGRAPLAGPACLPDQHSRGVLVLLETGGGGTPALPVLLRVHIRLDRVVADLEYRRQLNRPVLGVGVRIVVVPSRGDSGSGYVYGVPAAEQVVVHFDGFGEGQRSSLTPAPPRAPSPKAARRNDAGLGGTSDRVLQRDLPSSGDRRRGIVDRVRAPQVEARGRAGADANLARHVVRRHEVAARDAEKAQRVAVLLERGVHVAQPHRAPAGFQAGKRVAVGKGSRGSRIAACISLVDIDGLLQLADRPQPAAEGPAPAEAGM